MGVAGVRERLLALTRTVDARCGLAADSARLRVVTGSALLSFGVTADSESDPAAGEMLARNVTTGVAGLNARALVVGRTVLRTVGFAAESASDPLVGRSVLLSVGLAAVIVTAALLGLTLTLTVGLAAANERAAVPTVVASLNFALIPESDNAPAVTRTVAFKAALMPLRATLVALGLTVVPLTDLAVTAVVSLPRKKRRRDITGASGRSYGGVKDRESNRPCQKKETARTKNRPSWVCRKEHCQLWG
jgi:hypothetical protein